MKPLPLSLAAATALLAACSDPVAPRATAAAPGLTAPPVVSAEGTTAPSTEVAPGRPIPGKYLVLLADGTGPVAETARRLAAAHGGTVTQLYDRALRGFAIDVADDRARALAADPAVALVEQDQWVSGDAWTTQAKAPWSVDRLDQQALPLSTTFTYYRAGAGVSVYILDTGIRLAHTEFGGRASKAYDAIAPGDQGGDCNGHGTGVAGLVGGATTGPAKKAKLYDVRVLNCDKTGTVGTVVAGVNWVAGHAVKPAIANLSLSGPKSVFEDIAVQGLISTGVTVTVAAGNDNVDACTRSPARVPAAITAGATDSTDSRWWKSNWGPCLDLYAPGVATPAPVAMAPNASTLGFFTGTSMAAPLVAGVAAQYLEASPAATPAQVRDAIVNATVMKGMLKGAGAVAWNRLLHSNW